MYRRSLMATKSIKPRKSAVKQFNGWSTPDNYIKTSYQLCISDRSGVSASGSTRIPGLLSEIQIDNDHTLTKMKIMQDIIYEDNANEEKDFLHYRQKRDTRTLQEQKELSRDLLIAAIAIGAVLVLFFIIVVVVRVRKYMQNKKKVKKQPRGHGQKEKLQHTRNNRHSIKHGREEKALRSHRSQRSKMEPIAESEA
uniref:Uncharacterized protein n=1 Tax=Magallana gigas TaxID=29159 RepID=A0A8W8NTZ1_MAGGI